MPRQNNQNRAKMGSQLGKGMGTCARNNGSFADPTQPCQGRNRYGNQCTMQGKNAIPSQKESLTAQKERLQAQLATITEQLEKL